MSLNIQKLKIMLLTNTSNNNPIEFTKDVLYHPEFKTFPDIDKYPYITSKQLYPEDYLSNLEYDKIVNILFNKERLEEMLNEHKQNYNSNDESYILNKNVMTILELLFSTKYFIVNNIHQSLDLITHNDSYKSLFFNPFNTQFSYVKVNGKPHTVTKVIWLNDTVNHPKYNEIVNTVGEVIHKYKEKFPENPEMLNTEKNRLASDTVDFKELSYNLRNRLLPKLRFPYRESSNKEIQKSINMELLNKPESNINTMSKKQLYKFLTEKVLSSSQKEELKDKLSELKGRLNDTSNKQDFITLINKYNNYTHKFYDNFEKLYNRYILNNTDVNIPRELLDIGVDNINIEYNNEYPKREIFVMLDLIEGEVNEENKKEVYCPYTNDYLGNLLNTLVYKPDTSNIVKTKNSIYSTDDKITKTINKTSNTSSTTNTNLKPSNNNIDYNLFYSLIFNRTKNKEILDKMRPFIKDDDIIGFIKNNKELYDIIGKSISTTYTNNDFITQISRLNGRYNTEINILNESKKDTTQLPSIVQNINNDILKYNFYSAILNAILDYENKKPKYIGGGKKTKTIKATSKNKTKKLR